MGEYFLLLFTAVYRKSLEIPKVWKQITNFGKFLYKFTKSFDNLYYSLEIDSGGMGMDQNCIRGGSDWTFFTRMKLSFTRGWSDTGRGFQKGV